MTPPYRIRYMGGRRRRRFWWIRRLLRGLWERRPAHRNTWSSEEQ